MSTSTGKKLTKEIKQIKIMRGKPTSDLVGDVEVYVGRAEAVVTGEVSNTVDVIKKTTRRWMFAKGFLENFRSRKEGE